MSLDAEGPSLLQGLLTAILSLGGLFMKITFSRFKSHQTKLDEHIAKVDTIDKKLAILESTAVKEEQVRAAIREHTEPLNEGITRIFDKLDETNATIVDLRVSMARRRGES